MCSVIRIKSTESEPVMAHGFYPINCTARAKMAGIVNTVYCENNLLLVLVTQNDKKKKKKNSEPS